MTYDALNNMEDLTKSPLAVAASSLNSSDLMLFKNNVTKYAHNFATVIAIVTENVVPNANVMSSPSEINPIIPMKTPIGAISFR